MKPVTFKFVLPDPAKMIKAIVAEGGPKLHNSPTGQVNEDGVQLKWVMEDKSIAITVMKKPFYISMDRIKDELTTLFTQVNPPTPPVSVTTLPPSQPEHLG